MPKYEILIYDEIVTGRECKLIVEAEDAIHAQHIAEKTIHEFVYPDEVVSGEQPGFELRFNEEEVGVMPWSIAIDTVH